MKRLSKPLAPLPADLWSERCDYPDGSSVRRRARQPNMGMWDAFLAGDLYFLTADSKEAAVRLLQRAAHGPPRATKEGGAL